MKDDNTPDDAITHAVRTGAFDNLPGKGKPLNLEGYLNEDPETRLAHRMLRSHGYSLPWIEEMKELDRTSQNVQARLTKAWETRAKTLAEGRPAAPVEARWQQALADFRRDATELNRQILSFNLKAPSAQFHRSTLRIEAEIQRVTDRAAPVPGTRAPD